MKKPVPLYPVLLAAFPVIALFALNLAMVPTSDVWRPLGLAMASSVLLWALLAAAYRNVAKGAIASSIALAAFFSYGPLSAYLYEAVLLTIDVAIFLFAAIMLMRTGRDLAPVTKSLNFGAAVLVVLPVVQILMQRPPGKAESFLQVSLPVKATAATLTEKPDIFFIIVDGYGRADQLKRIMGYSNDGFVEQMRQRGFFVPDKSTSNYGQTQLSLASTLNLSFLQDFPKLFPPASEDRAPLGQGMDESFASAYLKRLGYTYIGVTSGFHEVHFDKADVHYDRPLAMTMLEDAVLQLTPISVVSGVADSQFEGRRRSLHGAIDNLTYLATPTSNPRFVVAHILAPHPPFVFDENGGPVRQKMPFGFWDGNHYMASNGSREMYRSGYVGQIQYLNKQLLKVVDAMIAKGRTPPVIIIQGDHGSKLAMNQERASQSDLKECFSNFMAFYVPPPVRNRLYPEITSVNTFRVLFNGLFGENLPRLPDYNYFSPFTAPYDFTDVTKQVKLESPVRF